MQESYIAILKGPPTKPEGWPAISENRPVDISFPQSITKHLVISMHSIGTESDNDLTVTFYNGQTHKVTCGKAVWIPLAHHDRISLELKMPKNARKDLEKQEGYPSKSFEGYPTSGKRGLTSHSALPRDFSGPLFSSLW